MEVDESISENAEWTTQHLRNVKEGELRGTGKRERRGQ